jgi:hypothetical protein
MEMLHFSLSFAVKQNFSKNTVHLRKKKSISLGCHESKMTSFT